MSSAGISGVGGLNVGSIFVSAGIDVANFEKDAKHLSRILGNIPNDLNKQSSIFSKFGELASSAFRVTATAAAAAATAIVTTGISTGVAYEQNAIAFQTMMGSADAGKKKLKELSDFAMKTPFSLPEAVEGGRRLLAMGVAADDLIPTFDMLGNIASGVGVEKLPQLILAFGQVKTATKLTGMELRQFTEAGVPLLELLAQVTGKSATQIKADMENGIRPSFEDVQKALKLATDEGGKFNGLMTKLAENTLGGRMQNLGDAFGKVARQIVGLNEYGEVMKDSFFDLLTKAAGTLLEKMDYLVKNFDDVSGAVVNAVKPVIQKIKEIGTIVINYLLPKLQTLWNTIRDNIIPQLSNLWNNILKPLAIVIGVTVVGAIGLLIDSLTFLSGGFTFLLPLVMGITGAFVAYKTTLFLVEGVTKAITIATGLYNLVMDVLAIKTATGTGFIAAFQIAMGLSTAATTGASVAMGIFNAVLNMNPIVLVVTLIGGLITALWGLSTVTQSNTGKTDELTQATKNLKDAQDRLTTASSSLHRANLDVIQAKENETIATRNAKDALEKYGVTSDEYIKAEAIRLVAVDDTTAAIARQKQAIDEKSKAEKEENKRVKELEDAEKKKQAALEATKLNIWNQKTALDDLNSGLQLFNGKTFRYNVVGETSGAKIPGRAAGGSVNAGEAYIVGENPDGSLNRTSELFVPRSAGNIFNNKDLTKALSNMRDGSNSIEYNIGTITIAKEVDGEAWLQKLTKNQEIVSKGLVPQTRYV